MKHFVTSDGISLAYEDEGEGTPVLCIPGLTRNGADFRPVVEGFRNATRIIRIDLRGRGASQYDDNFLNYNVLTEARDVIELLDHLGLPQVTVFGTSRGGLIALALAALARDRLRAVLLNDIGPHVDPEGMARIVEYLGLPPAEKTLDALAERHARETAAAFPGVSVAKWRSFLAGNVRETPDGLELCYDSRLRDAVITQLEEGPAPDLWPVFDLFAGLPLAVLHGVNSDILTHETVAEMRSRRPDLTYVPVKDRGHIPFLDEPECQAAIRAFITALPA